MAKYRIQASVESASGFQSFTVDADSPEEAIKAFNNGKSTFEFEEIEITRHSDVRLSDVTDISNEGKSE